MSCDKGPKAAFREAILATDIVGYNQLTEADEKGTLARLKALGAELLDPKVGEYWGGGRQDRGKPHTVAR